MFPGGPNEHQGHLVNPFKNKLGDLTTNQHNVKLWK